MAIKYFIVYRPLPRTEHRVRNNAPIFGILVPTEIKSWGTVQSSVSGAQVLSMIAESVLIRDQ